MSGRHPAIDFDAALHIGQEVEGRFSKEGINEPWRFRGRIVRLGKLTARVEALEVVGGWHVGHVFVLPRFTSPLWSDRNGMFPYHGAVVVEFKKKPEPADLLNQIMDYEQGEMSDEDMIVFFQGLIDTGLAWQLQGHYGRTAARLIEAGHCHRKGA